MLSAKIARPLLFASALLASQTTLSQALNTPNPAKIKRADTPVPPRHSVFDGLAPAAGHTVATEKTADVPATAAAHTSTIAGELVPYDTPEFDFERATTPEIVKFFLPYEAELQALQRRGQPKPQFYGPLNRELLPKHTQALARRANTHPDSNVFRVLKAKHIMTQTDLFNPVPSRGELPIAAVTDLEVVRRIMADLDSSPSSCAFKCFQHK